MGLGARGALPGANAGSFLGPSRGVTVPKCQTCFARVHLAARVRAGRRGREGTREQKTERASTLAHPEDGRGGEELGKGQTSARGCSRINKGDRRKQGQATALGRRAAGAGLFQQQLEVGRGASGPGNPVAMAPRWRRRAGAQQFPAAPGHRGSGEGAGCPPLSSRRAAVPGRLLRQPPQPLRFQGRGQDMALIRLLSQS